MGKLASLIAGFASGETALAVARARRAAIAYLLAGTAMVCGLGFFVGAGYIWAAGQYGPIGAALGIGVLFFVLAGIIVLAHKLSARARERRAVTRRRSEMTTVAVTSALAILPALLRGKAGLGTIIAPAIVLAAYAIYRENRKPKPIAPDSDKA
jgi:hypothetical protein